MTLIVALIFVVGVFALILVAAMKLQDGFAGFKRELMKPAQEEHAAKIQALRNAGYSEEWIQKTEQIQVLRATRKFDKIAPWIIALIVLPLMLIFFPPIGLVFTGITVISAIRGISLHNKEANAKAAEIARIQASMPEK